MPEPVHKPKRPDPRRSKFVLNYSRYGLCLLLAPCFALSANSCGSAASLMTSPSPTMPPVRRSAKISLEQSDLDLQDLGNKERSSRNYGRAIGYYTAALNKAPGKALNERASIYFDRAIALDLLNHGTDATRDFREALKLFQDYERLNPLADDSGPVSLAINDINAQLALRNSTDTDEETYTRNVTVRRWPEKRLPLRIHIDSSKNNGFDPALTGEIFSAAREWSNVPGVFFRWVPLADARGADIIILRSSNEHEFVDGGSRIDFEYKEDENNSSEISVVRIKIYCPGHKAAELSSTAQANFYTSLLHAFGHAFGVDGHSANGGDAMYWKSSVAHLSRRDQMAFRQIYE